MKRPVVAAALLAATLLTSGCAAEAVTGTVAAQSAQGTAGHADGEVEAMQRAKDQLEAKAYSARIVAEHSSMMAGGEWTVTGAGWKPGAAVTISLTNAAGAAVGAPVHAVADTKGQLNSTITPPEGTVTGPYTLTVVDPADGSGPHTAAVNVFSQ